MPRKKNKKRTEEAHGNGSTKSANTSYECETVLESSLEDIQRLDELGIGVQVGNPTSDENATILACLESTLNPEELKYIKESGTFNDITLDCENVPKSLPYEFPGSAVRSSPLPVPVVAKPVLEEQLRRQDELMGLEIRHLSALLEPAEFRTLLIKLITEQKCGRPVTHTDISDYVMHCVAPSMAEKLTLALDAQYKYTTAQFVQVYNKLRHVVLANKIMLEDARVNALAYILADLPQPQATLPDGEQTPVSAVKALRKLLNNDMLHKVDAGNLDFSIDDVRKFIDL